MAPLTSPSGCANCTVLIEKVTELERRISTLYTLREAELQMDTIIFRTTPQVSVSSSPNQPTRPSSAPADDSSLSPPGVTAPDGAAAASELPPPISSSEHSWIRQGAKPKSITTSTPRDPASWTLVAPRSGRSQQPPDSLHHTVHLNNRYDALARQDFTLKKDTKTPQLLSPLSTNPLSLQTPSQRPPHRAGRRLSFPHFTPAPARLPATPPSCRSPAARAPPTITDPPPTSSVPHPLFPPTTLLLGDSIIRNVRFFNVITHCIPGASVTNILDKLPVLLHTLPPSVHRIIIHVGCVDASRRQSEITKTVFNKLFHYIQTTGKSVFISGPISPHNRGSGLFSRILSLHTWLQSACRSHSLSYIDNFNLFWARESFFRADGLHPNKLGSCILTANIQHAVQNPPCD